MAKRKINPPVTRKEDTLIDLGEVSGKAKSFLDQYQNTILGVVTAVAVVIGGIWAYINLYKLPKEIEAADQMFQAEFMFQKDSFQMALDNPGGGFDGFISIIDKYSGTKAANIAKYYAGICHLNLGNFDEAISFLNSHSPKTELMTIMTYGALGDAYSEKGEMEKAASFYQKAIKSGDNKAVTPYYLKKYALLQEKQGNSAEAMESYLRIQKDYPESFESDNIEKYIYRAQAAKF